METVAAIIEVAKQAHHELVIPFDQAMAAVDVAARLADDLQPSPTLDGILRIGESAGELNRLTTYLVRLGKDWAHADRAAGTRSVDVAIELIEELRFHYKAGHIPKSTEVTDGSD